MDSLAFEHHLVSPQGAGHVPDGAVTATAGGYACCDEITFSVAVEGDRVSDAGFQAHGCGSAHAAGSAAVELVRGALVLDAARVGPAQIAAERSAAQNRPASLAGPSAISAQVSVELLRKRTFSTRMNGVAPLGRP